MSVAGESASRAQQMQDKVRELNERAERTSDPKERRRLHDEARRMQEQSMKEGGRGAGDGPGHRAGGRQDEFPSR
jgi:TolA-binding protein